MKAIFYFTLFAVVVSFAECTAPVNLITGEPCKAENGWHYLNKDFSCVDSASAVCKMRSIPLNGFDYFTSTFFHPPFLKILEAKYSSDTNGPIPKLDGHFEFNEKTNLEASVFKNGELHYHLTARSEKDEWELMVYKDLYRGQKYFTTYHLNSRLKTVSKVILTTLDSSERPVVKELPFNWWMRESYQVELNDWTLQIETEFKYWNAVEEMIGFLKEQ
ncbi:MAG: hypothetical protein AB8B53_00880 [Flavobacteriales bacterium]